MNKATFTQFSLLVLALLFATSAGAQTELLDPDFGTVGRQALTLPAPDQVHDLLIQPDGKILTAGKSLEGESFRASLVRYLPDGSLDPVFGINGKNHLLLPEDGPRSADALALQSNGKIVALETYGYELARYQSNGYLDPSFQAQLDFLIYYHGLAVGPDDEILLSGSRLGNLNGFVVTRLLPDGAKDLAFGNNGTVSFDFGPGYEGAVDVAVQPDGKIVAFGSYDTPGSPVTTDLIVVRLNADGTPDDSFGTNGIIVMNSGQQSTTAHTLILQTDGKIVVGVSYWVYISLFRFNPDGTVDSAFGTNGEAHADDFYNAFGFTQAPDGSFYAVGSELASGAILKFTPAGLPDSSFATAGVLHTELAFYRIAVQSDSALVAAATLAEDFAVARYLPDGGVDAAFNGGALVLTGIGQSGGSFEALAVQPDGKIVAAGSNRGIWPVLARFSPEGIPDTDFISKDKFSNPYNGAFHALALQPDGKILIGGQYNTGESTAGLLYRLLPDGTPDSSFSSYSGGGGKSLALQPDGRILSAGVNYDDLGNYYSYLFRMEADGEYDPDFGVNGVVYTNPCICDRMTLQADGNILVAGNLFPTNNYVAYRYRNDGSPDSTFGTNGVMLTPKFEFLKSLPDGRFLLSVNTASGFTIYRFLQNGMPDTDFGIDGQIILALNNGEIIHAMEVLPDGKMLLAGEAAGDQGETFFLLGRLLPDGAPDVSAGMGGFVTTGFNDLFAYDQAYTMVVQPDGKIVLAGTSLISTDTSAYFAFSMARYRADLTVESKEIITSGSAPVLQLSPNPASDALHIQINDPEKWDINILDTQGRQMYRQETTRGQTVSVKDWPSGIYVVIAVSGKRFFSAKVVKQ
ncbi:MAG: T9SS type A sorting domain-containing protein [Saprospiraceae bacterium]|nr:T9SS type A sorting domain-containing protein [Saprospiraceae bacterium]